MLDNPFWQHWYFHLPNYLLAVLVYTMLGRFILSLFLPPQSGNYIWRFFRRLTDPVLVAVGFITPRFIAPFLLPLVSVFWLTVLRIALLALLFAIGLAPHSIGPAAP